MDFILIYIGFQIISLLLLVLKTIYAVKINVTSPISNTFRIFYFEIFFCYNLIVVIIIPFVTLGLFQKSNEVESVTIVSLEPQCR